MPNGRHSPEWEFLEKAYHGRNRTAAQTGAAQDGEGICAALTLLNRAEARGDFNAVETHLKDIIIQAARYGAANEWRKLGKEPPP